MRSWKEPIPTGISRQQLRMTLLDQRLAFVDELDHCGEVRREDLFDVRVDLRLLKFPKAGPLL